ncbi:protein phosphatase 2C domain-containing protein [Prochlorococcus marinus]|uniref:PPM-type phosphatase domain-containing protein n=1 Tax=Prochlorococcus marinus (strain MIT 9303) TaxID=59922 RepID=A2CDN5_PROM3|nr:protein phosphatase 2C domain-containing protein [Prochlorococcus marinus]ABM79595.1 Hypothetical protein P9303_28651 [Prochlorococcus marinus str. MIT 9303]
MNWQPPVYRSLIGASHRRKGVVCQDYSLSASFRSRSGVPIKLMVVADGHGGTRYWRSDVGSKLACEIALQQARKDVGRRLLSWSAPSRSTLSEWHQWLKRELPGKIMQNWRFAVANDWRRLDKTPEQEAEGFSLYTYGSTLGLVILMPHWWGCTGIGDWDLVRVGANKGSGSSTAELINSEDSLGIKGESTFSLCKSDALLHFTERSCVQRIDRKELPYALMLSTDGIRKSCTTDTDFLALADYLVSEVPATGADGECIALDEGLNRITTEGSGDDVSVAIDILGQ